MLIKELNLTNFRNFKNESVNFSPGINIIYGNNAQGKTSLLESIFLASTGRSHRSRYEKELILFGETFSDVRVVYEKDNFENNVRVYLRQGEKKAISVNGSFIKRIGELFGEIQTVIFSPEDLSIVNDSPFERRRFMDMQICQISPIYYYNLSCYHKSLKQRNSLLKSQKDNDFYENLAVWDAQLAEHGKRVIAYRKWFLEQVNSIAYPIHHEITNGIEDICVEYKPSVSEEHFYEKLKRNYERDLIYRSTSIGPHKDDIVFYINNKDARTYGSQGQKRTIILSCRLAEIEIVKNEMGYYPILLLDDAFSELDQKRQMALVKYIGGNQSFITATGMEDLVSSVKNDARLFYIKNGEITEEARNEL